MKVYRSFYLYVVLFCLSILSADISSAAEYCKFYEHPDRQGAYLEGELEDRSYVGDRWNDKISSVWVENGYTVTIYEHPHFDGKSQTLYGKPGGSVYNLTDTNFDDRVSSYKIRSSKADRSGRDLYCKFYEHPNRKGAHLKGELGNIEYVGSQWDDRISSVWVRNGYTVTIFEHAYFEGKNQILYGKRGGAVYNLTDTNFNDKVSSYKIREGSYGDADSGHFCRFYEHPNRKGAYLEGDLENRSYVGNRWNDKISSVWIEDGYTVTLYEHPHFEGKSKVLNGKSGGAVYDLTDMNFNDKVSSYKIRKGKTDDNVSDQRPGDDLSDQRPGDDLSDQRPGDDLSDQRPGDRFCRFYEEPNRRGAHLDGNVGNRSDVGERWNDKISSVWVGKGYTVTIYDHPRFQGKSRVLDGKSRGAVYNLTDMNFDNKISSYKIRKSGRDDSGGTSGDSFCIFYEHPDRRGSHLEGELGNKSDVEDRWDDKISSVWIENGYRVILYENARFRGKRHVLYGREGGIVYNLADFAFDDMISSYKVQKSRSRR